MDYLQILKENFGFADFRGIQREIVESIGAGNDTLGLMPTGGGKSITFQVPAMAKEGVCIVVTPLIALMKDQVAHLRQRGILASAVFSGMSYPEILKVLDNAVYGGVKFLYVSPERLSSPLFLTKVKQMKICFITVDEAHCISQWGYDFRPSYLRIAEIREIVGVDVPILALTATATPAVVDDIQEKLGFSEKNVFRMSFKRENLVYVVRKTDNKEAELIHILNSVGGSAIVYTRSRKGTRDIARMLSSNDIPATYYHAGLDFAVKDQRQQEWQNDEVRVMVATNAFGMGIDKPDVRIVVHMDCPDSIEAYFQEAGRGGRDGKRSYAVLLFSNTDRRSLLKRVQAAFPEKEYIRQVYDHLAYFFQLAVYSGEGARYEFDMDRFCKVFHHFPTRLEGALNVLQRAGYIEHDPDPDNHPRCQFLVCREELYRLKGLNKNEDAVILALLRCYGNLFSDLAYIEIGNLAKYAGLTADDVHVCLKMLAQRRLIKYIPRRNVPIIYYPCQRIDSNRLVFPHEIYEDLMEQMRKRVSAVLEYAESDEECRSVMLLRYFGEIEADDCGKCDVCQAHREVSRANVMDAKQKILKAISDAGGKMLIADLPEIPMPREELFAAVDDLRENQELTIVGRYVHLCE